MCCVERSFSSRRSLARAGDRLRGRAVVRVRVHAAANFDHAVSRVNENVSDPTALDTVTTTDSLTDCFLGDCFDSHPCLQAFTPTCQLAAVKNQQPLQLLHQLPLVLLPLALLQEELARPHAMRSSTFLPQLLRLLLQHLVVFSPAKLLLKPPALTQRQPQPIHLPAQQLLQQPTCQHQHQHQHQQLIMMRTLMTRAMTIASWQTSTTTVPMVARIRSETDGRSTIACNSILDRH